MAHSSSQREEAQNLKLIPELTSNNFIVQCDTDYFISIPYSTGLGKTLAICTVTFSGCHGKWVQWYISINDS